MWVYMSAEIKYFDLVSLSFVGCRDGNDADEEIENGNGLLVTVTSFSFVANIPVQTWRDGMGISAYTDESKDSCFSLSVLNTTDMSSLSYPLRQLAFGPADESLTTLYLSQSGSGVPACEWKNFPCSGFTSANVPLPSAITEVKAYTDR